MGCCCHCHDEIDVPVRRKLRPGERDIEAEVREVAEELSYILKTGIYQKRSGVNHVRVGYGGTRIPSEFGYSYVRNVEVFKWGAAEDSPIAVHVELMNLEPEVASALLRWLTDGSE